MSRHYTAGTIKHTNSFDDNFRAEFNKTFKDEAQEYAETKERAATHEELKKELREKAVKGLSDVLDPQQTEFFDWNNTATFAEHLKKFEDNFEKAFASVIEQPRQSILNYTATIVNSIINTGTSRSIAFKLLKRLAIRLGYSQYTVHF